MWCWTALIDLVLPRECVACRRPGELLCRRCRGSLAPVLSRRAGLAVWAAASYDSAIGPAVVAYKERGRRELADPLGALLADAVRAARPPPDTRLVGVPSSRAAARARGGDHVARLVRRGPARCGWTAAPVLHQTRQVRDSAGLGRAERLRNVRGSLAAQPPDRPGAPALLIDDIVTTGATLGEAARALRVAGWRVHGAAVVAATPAREPA